MHFISVVVISYNLENYILEALSSVCRQTYSCGEVILADDNSTDETVSLVRKHFPSVVVSISCYRQSPLLNAFQGFLRTKGDLVFFLDGDDVWMPDKLERCVSEFDANPAHFLVSHSHLRVNESLSPLHCSDVTSRNIDRIFAGPVSLVQSRLRASLLFRRGFWLGSAYGFRRQYFNEKIFSDIVLNSPLSSSSYLDLVLGPYLAFTNPLGTIGYIHNHYFFYRIHQSNSAASDSVISQMKALRRMKATTVLTAKVLKVAGAKPSEISNTYLPILFYLKYVGFLLGRAPVMSAKYFILSRSIICSTPFSLLREILRLASFVIPFGPQMFFYCKKILIPSYALLYRLMVRWSGS